ncbi:MAG: RNA polymerase sigma factor [Cytophagales bacterium]|nr:RNA polymerase sigma factor [Cytophagales bacterium]MDW3197663.1 RNA polymerase sigma factor [Cytophagales bacterium]
MEQTLDRKELRKCSDEELISLIVDHSRADLFELIYDRYARKIYQKCLSFTKDDSEAMDVAHDIIVKLFTQLTKFSGKSKFSTWVYKVTYNCCVDYQAQKKKKLSISEELALEAGKSEPSDVPDDSELMELSIDTLEELMELLTPAEKSIILMKYQDGMSIKEIAVLTQAGESSVKMKLKRTKAKLIALYEKR